MELVYCVDVQNGAATKEWVSEDRFCTSLSSRNILAISKPSENEDSQFDLKYDIQVLDLDKPWELHQVTTTTQPVVQLEWDTTGTKLLVIDLDGDCHVWCMKNHLLNKWNSIGSICMAGEEVLALMWFHNGLQIIFDPDKRDKSQYIEKFTRNYRHVPSLVHFGGSHVDGWILVTASGLVSVGVILSETEIITAKHNLAPTHMRLTCADIANTGNGDIMIATSDGQLSSAVQCFLVSLKLVQDSIIISCKASASLYMKTQMEYGNNESQVMRITNMMFMNNESNDTLFVCCGSSTYCCLEVWQLLEQMMPLHKLFAMNTAPDTMNKTPKWMHKATIPHPSLLTSIAGPKLPMSRNLVETTGFLPYIATAYRDGTIQLIHRYTFQVISTTNVDSLCQQVQSFVATGDKKQRVSVQISNMLQTGSGCGILGLHNGKLFLFRTFNGSRDSTMQLSAMSIVLLLEYMMLTGLDWWDILLAVRQGMIMNICQSLTDDFQKQTHSMQELVFMRLLSMKMALFSSYSAGHQKAVDYHARLVLHAIGTMIKGILKPRTITVQDKSPAEKVSLLCGKHTDGDIETIVANLETDEFHVDVKKKDKTETSLHHLQPLIQWVSDFSLQLLASIPLFQSYSSFSGSSLLNDSSVLSLLRDLLVIFRMWGVISPGCQPTFTTTSNLDCLKHMYKLLTRAWSCSREGRSIEYDDSLQDECCVLPSKVLIPSINQSFRMDYNGFSVFTQQLPLVFMVGEEPEYLHLRRQAKSHHKVMADNPLLSAQNHDIVRQIHLGTNLSELMRQCSRCGCHSLLHTLNKSAIMKAWEQRWVKQCLCGGHWKLVK